MLSSIHSSTYPLSKSTWGLLEPIPASIECKRGKPRMVYYSITQPHTLTFTLNITVTNQSLKPLLFFIVGGSRSTQRNPTRAQVKHANPTRHHNAARHLIHMVSFTFDRTTLALRTSDKKESQTHLNTLKTRWVFAFLTPALVLQSTHCIAFTKKYFNLLLSLTDFPTWCARRLMAFGGFQLLGWTENFSK